MYFRAYVYFFRLGTIPIDIKPWIDENIKFCIMDNMGVTLFSKQEALLFSLTHGEKTETFYPREIHYKPACSYTRNLLLEYYAPVNTVKE
jgi:hypothetical protein